MGQPASIFHECDPSYLAKIAQILSNLTATAKDAKQTLQPEDWKHVCDRANTLFNKKNA